MDRVRVMRILVYEGNRAWVEDTLSKSLVPLDGAKQIGDNNTIKSALVDKFPEVLKYKDQSSSYKGKTLADVFPPGDRPEFIVCPSCKGHQKVKSVENPHIWVDCLVCHGEGCLTKREEVTKVVYKAGE